MIKTIKGKIVAIAVLMLLVLYLITSIFAYQSYRVNKLLTREGCDLQVTYFAEKINKELKVLETSVLDLATMGRMFVTPPVQPEWILDYKVKANFENNFFAVGGGVWFEPYKLYKNKYKAYAYAFRKDNEVIIDEKNRKNYFYNKQLWYEKAKKELTSSHQVVWTEPYYDVIGTKKLMTTVAAGIFDNGEFVGVATEDWVLESIVEKIATLCPTKGSFTVFADKNNDFIMAFSDKTKEKDLFGKSLTVFPWYSEELKNGDIIKYNGVKYISFVKQLDNNMVLIVNVPMHELYKVILHWYEITMIILFLACFSIAWLLYIVLLKNINKPIRYLTNTAKKIANGNLNLQMNIEKPEEFAHLADVFNRMTKDIQVYVENITKITADKERVKQELEIAKSIQESILPTTFPPYPTRKEFDIYASMNAAKEVGGDFYDFFFIDSDRFAYLVADVSGKGVPAALFMMSAKIRIKNLAKTGLPLKEVVEIVNNKICKKNSQGFFVTMFLAITDLRTGETTFVNAGHNPPLLKRANGNFEYLSIKPNLVLGALSDINYEVEETILNPNDALFFYTDGVTEASNSKELYGEDRLELAINNLYDEAKDINDLPIKLKANIEEFVSGENQTDDITMLIFRYNGSQNGDNLVRVQREKLNANIKTIFLPAKVSNWLKVQNWLEEACSESEVSKDDIMKLNLVLEEIFVNISSYAYPPKEGEVQVDFRITENDEVEIKFTDGGTHYNPLEKLDPDINLPPEERPVGGLGIFMVKQIVDYIDYQYENEKNILTVRIKMTK